MRIALFGSREVAQAQNALVPRFKEKVPEVEDVEFIPIQGTDWEEFFSKVLTQLAAGDPPDITFVATEGTQLFAAEGIAIPLDDYVKRDKEEMKEYFSDVHPTLVEAMMYEGSLYELPLDFNAANLYYNVELLEEAGIGRPAPEWTKDDFYDLVSNWKNEKVAGYNWVNRLWGSWTPWMFNNGTNLLTEEHAPGGDWLWNIYLRLAAPALAVLAILSFNFHWNEFFRPLIFLTSDEKFTLPLGLVTLQGYLGTGNISVVLAGVVMSLVPVMIVFILGQRYRIEGITVGGIKG